MQTLDLTQGSPEWHAARATRFCASDAASMLGLSKNENRADFMRLKATGGEKEFSAWAQRHLLDKGHEAEYGARFIAEGVVGDTLFPTIGVLDIDGMQLLASFDGITMDEGTTWEHKLFAEWLAEHIEINQDLPDSHWPQVEHQLLVSGAARALLMTSDGTKVNERHFWYVSRPERRQYVLDGWKQFAADLAVYVPTEIVTKAVAAPIAALPSLSVQVTGSLAVQDNLSVFGERLKAFVQGLNEKPQNDQDFADAEAAIKALVKAEDALQQAEASAMGQVASVDDLKRIIALHYNLARTTRLRFEKLVKAEKENRRVQIIQAATSTLNGHVEDLNSKFARPYLPKQTADFASVIKGMKSITSIQNAIDTLLVQAKTDATLLAGRIQTNVETLNRDAQGLNFLFPDVAGLVLKEPETCELHVKSRVNEHKAAEAQRLEAERESIRVEEAEKLRLEAAAAVVTAPTPTPVPTPAPGIVPTPAQTYAPTYVRTPLTAVPSSATTTLGQISARLGFAITAAFLAELGFESAGRDRSAVLFRESDFPLICNALVKRIILARDQPPMANAA